MINPLRLARLTKGISQIELAQKTGISNDKICRWERWGEGLEDYEIKKLARALKVKPEKVLV